MSLMRLLTSGKTLVDLKSPTSRYHMPGKNILPKFGSVKNPFATQSPAQSALAPKTPIATAPEPNVATPALMALKETQKLPIAPQKLKETKRLPFVASRNGVQKQTSSPAVIKKILHTLGVAFQKLNVLAWRTSRESPVKSAIPRFDKSGVQGELSLDNIKVVRNDLSEADVEIVPAKAATMQTNFNPALQSQPKTGMAVTESCLT
jgi:hypothetical protein